MNWKKLGKIFHADNYAQTPTPMVMDDRVRVYFAARDGENKSFIAHVDLDVDDPTKVIGFADATVLPRGPIGSFDADGQMPSFAMRSGQSVNLYYSGWSALASGGYQNSIGVALSNDGGKTFRRGFDGPIMDRTNLEAYLAVTPCLSADGGMFYISGIRWEEINGKPEPIYGICQATSRDGFRWERNGKLVIPQAHALECFSRPWVMKGNVDRHLWYCYRSAVDYRDGPGAYRIGYAVSKNGRDFVRQDSEAGIDVSADGWDSKMIAYPAVFEAKGKLYMLYNGSGFGRYGFGLAVAQ